MLDPALWQIQTHCGDIDVSAVLWVHANQKDHLHYRKTSSISRTLVSNKIVDNSDVVGASPVGTAPTTSSFST